MKILLVVVLLGSLTGSWGLQCYTCSMGENDASSECINDKTKWQITDCSKKYCNVFRVEYLDPKNLVQSISRGCTNINSNTVTEDSTNRIYESTCSFDLCNDGSGKTGKGNKGSLGDKTTIYCPGTKSFAPSNFEQSLYPVFLAAIIFLLV